jgi:hypothetical protein
VTAHAAIVVTAKNQSPGLSGDGIEAAKARLANPGMAWPRRLAGDALSIHSRRRNREFPERCRVQLNQADRLGVYVGAEIHGDFSPRLQL